MYCVLVNAISAKQRSSQLEALIFTNRKLRKRERNLASITSKNEGFENVTAYYSSRNNISMDVQVKLVKSNSEKSESAEYYS